MKRLGKTPWIKPYTDLILEEPRQKKVENIAIVCPSFVSDCLETLEEINIRARSQWLKLGGHDFVFIPCLNTHPAWVKCLIKMIKGEPLRIKISLLNAALLFRTEHSLNFYFWLQP